MEETCCQLHTRFPDFPEDALYCPAALARPDGHPTQAGTHPYRRELLRQHPAQRGLLHRRLSKRQVKAMRDSGVLLQMINGKNDLVAGVCWVKKLAKTLKCPLILTGASPLCSCSSSSPYRIGAHTCT